MTIDGRQPMLSELSRKRKFALLDKYLPAGSHVLEVGTGDGWFARNLRENGYDVVTLDWAASADIVGDIRNWRNLGLAEKSFDAVVALEVVEHVDCLDDLRALCKPNGLIMLSSPHPSWDWVMKIFERLRLTQHRTSEHDNLTDLTTIDLARVVLQRPLFVHQVALFRNASQSTTSADA
jgi:2-polyprenyl-3-methyl-5-hydroxy-6-metoxy-1,4-benzoquinol methylase